MSSVNKVILIGHLGRDPEIRSTQSGMRIANLSLATSESWVDKSSRERKEKTEWHRISVMNEALVTVAEKYLRKGSQVYVEGQLQTRQWNDKEGATRYTTEIILSKFRGVLTMLGGKEARDDEPAATPAPASASLADELDDAIPF